MATPNGIAVATRQAASGYALRALPRRKTYTTSWDINLTLPRSPRRVHAMDIWLPAQTHQSCQTKEAKPAPIEASVVVAPHYRVGRRRGAC